MILLLAAGPCLCAASPAFSPDPSEEAAWTAARAEPQPAQRIAALREFVQAFPQGAHVNLARTLLLRSLLDDPAGHTTDIATVAAARLAASSAGIERWLDEAHTADLLADAGDHGVDLADAQHWAEDAVASLTEPAYRHQLLVMQARYRLPALPPHQAHAQFSRDRAVCLAALAHVLLQQGSTARASSLVLQALQLDPLSAEANRLQGELLLAQGRRPEALAALLRADAITPLPAPVRAQELALFQDLGHGDAAALDLRLDTVARDLYGASFTLPPRRLPAGGHPVLLELFTGSDCAPCAGPDLAIDSLLHTYGPQDLIALEFDEHIPEPDPLATPDSAERAAFYSVEATPTAFLDGAPLPIGGSVRADVENIVVGFADSLEAQAAQPSGLGLALGGAWQASGDLQATLHLRLLPAASHNAARDTSGPGLQVLQRSNLYLALVQDDIHYPGLNGVRLHRMVVRALHQVPAATALAGVTLPFSPQHLEAQQGAYLARFEQNNAAFGTFHFRTTQIPVDLHDLLLVAWVQDPVTHQVFGATRAALPPP